MKALWTPTLFLALTGALALSACGDDTTVVKADATLDTTFGDVPESDVPNDQVNPNAVRLLDFEQPFGDDQKACKGQPRCSIFIGFSEIRTIKLVYTEDGVPTAARTVKFSRENDDADIGFVSTQSAVTDPTGIAQATVKARVQAVGQFTIKAYVEGENAPPPKYFDVVVTPKGQVPLTVIATYNGTRPVAAFSSRLYKQNAQGAPTCADMRDLLDNQQASQSRDNVPLNQSAKFPEFDNLETDGTQKYTLLAFSENSNQTVQAWGCDNTVQVEWGKSKTVEVPLLDRPPLYAGAYTVTSKFDFISAIPEPYRTYVNYVVKFFQDPTGTLLTLACDLLTAPGDTLNSFCGLVFNEDPNTHELTLSALGGFVSDLLNAVIQGLAHDSVFGTIFQVGGDVADILKQFEITATFNFNKEPHAEGEGADAKLVFADGDTNENWHTVKVKWTLGANCDTETEAGCGVRSFSTSLFQTAAITGTFKASVTNYYDLTIDMHPLNLRYGALVNYFVEAVLIPLVVKNDTVNSYEELLGFLVGGGADCLDGTVCPNNPNQPSGNPVICCCNQFADKTVDNPNGDGQVDGGTEGAIVAACNVITKTAPTFLRGTLQGLDLDTGDGFNIGTKSKCKLQDANDDLIIDNIGQQALPCQWNVELKFGSGSPVTIDSLFYGKRAEQ